MLIKDDMTTEEIIKLLSLFTQIKQKNLKSFFSSEIEHRYQLIYSWSQMGFLSFNQFKFFIRNINNLLLHAVINNPKLGEYEIATLAIIIGENKGKQHEELYKNK